MRGCCGVGCGSAKGMMPGCGWMMRRQARLPASCVLASCRADAPAIGGYRGVCNRAGKQAAEGGGISPLCQGAVWGTNPAGVVIHATPCNAAQQFFGFENIFLKGLGAAFCRAVFGALAPFFSSEISSGFTALRQGLPLQETNFSDGQEVRFWACFRPRFRTGIQLRLIRSG